MAEMPQASEDFGYDTEITALLADLEASIASFDDRMEQRCREESQSTQRVTSTNTYPEVDPDAVFSNVAKPMSAPLEAVRETPPADSVADVPDLLLELRSAVDSLSDTERRGDADEAAQRKNFSDVLRSTFSFFHELTQHLNALRPTLPCRYTLGGAVEFEGPAWQRGNAHAKMPESNEFHLVNAVVVRGTCNADSDLAIACPRHQSATFRHEMALLNVQILDEDERSDAAKVRFVLSREIRIQLQFSSCFESRSILIHSRNVAGFGLAAYSLRPEHLDREALNILGEQLLGRRNSLPSTFRPIPFSYGLARK